jgi:three-Cys-motif partner protein
MKGVQLSFSLFPEEPNNQENYFTRKRSWSASKHRIMLRYIQSFCYNLGGNKPYQSEHLNYVDGFAGIGKYTEGIGIEDFVNNSKFWSNKYEHEFENTDGSPLIALKCAKLFRQEKRVNLRCFFIESKPDFNKKLRANCETVAEALSYKIYKPQTFEVAFPELIKDLENYPTLFFLDIFAVKGITFDTICDIGNYVSQYKGELFLLFHNIQVARNAGQYKTTYANSKEQQTAESFIKNLTNLLGVDSDLEWKPKWLQLKDQPQEFERWALEYFKERMRKEGGFKGVTSFEIKETYNDIRPQYSIVVGSNHPEKAFGYFLNDFVFEENKLLFFQDNYEGIQKFLDKEWQAEEKKRLAIIKTQSIQILHQIKPEWQSFEDVITHFILKMDDLGCLKRTQYYKDILGSLYQEGMLEIQNPGSRDPYTLKSLLRIVE